MTKIMGDPTDFDIETTGGNVLGFSHTNKFGRNIQVDSGITADIWDGGHTGDVSLIWVAPTQARKHDFKSSSGDDASGGLGARTVRFFGLPDWDTKETSEVITMNGTNNVATTNDYVIIHRIQVLTKGGTSSNVGVITATAQTDNTITAQIRAGQGQTQMSIMGVASTQTCFIGRVYGDVNKAGGATGLIDMSLMVNPEPDAELTNFNVLHTFGLQTVGTSALSIIFTSPKTFKGPGIIKIQSISGTNNMDVSAGFDTVLRDN